MEGRRARKAKVAGGQARKAKGPEWNEDEREFRDVLYYGPKSDLVLSLVHRIAIAEHRSPPPVVFDLDWHPEPQKSGFKGARAILACASSYGAHMYYLKRSTNIWMTLVMNNRPTRQGDCVRWHHSGAALATTSNPTDLKNGNIRIFSYNGITNQFDSSGKCMIGGQRKVTSLAWLTGTDILVSAIYPTPRLFLYELKEGDINRIKRVDCEGFPPNSPIILQPHLSSSVFFAASLEATQIQIWDWDSDDKTLTILRRVDCEKGIRGLEFDIDTMSLFTIQKGYWKAWSLNYRNEMQLRFSSVNEHPIVNGKTFKYRSELISFGCSRNGKFVASGGDGDTFLVHVKPASRAAQDSCIAFHWNPEVRRNRNFCFGQVRCIKFNPKDEDANLRIATGCEKGFIHFWALKMGRQSKDKGKVDPDRNHEHIYYSNYLNPEKIRIPSTSSDDEEEEEEEEKGDDDDEDSDDEEEDDDEDVNHNVVREREHEVYVEYVDIDVRKVKNVREYQIQSEARTMLNIIKDGGNPAKEHVKALCEKITAEDIEE